MSISNFQGQKLKSERKTTGKIIPHEAEEISDPGSETKKRGIQLPALTTTKERRWLRRKKEERRRKKKNLGSRLICSVPPLYSLQDFPQIIIISEITSKRFSPFFSRLKYLSYPGAAPSSGPRGWASGGVYRGRHRHCSLRAQDLMRRELLRRR